jgi:hypothetical protein
MAARQGGNPVPQVVDGAQATIETVAGYAINGGGEGDRWREETPAQGACQVGQGNLGKRRAKATSPRAKAEKAAKPDTTGTPGEAAARSHAR